MTPVIHLQGISKHFHGRTVLDTIDLKVFSGSLHVLTGANGAGKSTLVRIACGLIHPDDGNVLINGMLLVNDVASEHMLGVLYDDVNFFNNLTIYEFINLISRFRNDPKQLKEAKVLLNRFKLNLGDPTLLRDLSLGTRKKVLLVSQLMHRPTALILDEPFNSLDPIAVRELLNICSSLVQSGTGILLVSHPHSMFLEDASAWSVLDDAHLTTFQCKKSFLLAYPAWQSTSS